MRLAVYLECGVMSVTQKQKTVSLPDAFWLSRKSPSVAAHLFWIPSMYPFSKLTYHSTSVLQQRTYFCKIHLPHNVTGKWLFVWDLFVLLASSVETLSYRFWFWRYVAHAYSIIWLIGFLIFPLPWFIESPFFRNMTISKFNWVTLTKYENVKNEKTWNLLIQIFKSFFDFLWFSWFLDESVLIIEGRFLSALFLDL